MSKIELLIVIEKVFSTSLDNKIIRIAMRNNSNQNQKRKFNSYQNNYHERLINNHHQYNLRKRGMTRR